MRPKRRRTIVHDEPIPQVRPQPKHFLDPTEAPVETQPREQLTSVDKLERRETERVISHVYDEGRLVTQPRPRPSQQPPPVFDERKFIANPNFGKKSPRKTQVYRFGEAAPSPIIVRRQKPVYSEEPVVRERLLVHSGEPHVNQERRLVPVQKRSFVYTEERPRMYTMERSRAYIDEVSRGLVQGRPRANSDEERVFIDGRGRVYTSKRSRKYKEEIQRVVRQGRPRANSDGGPPEYSGDKPRMFTEEFIPAATPVITMQTQPPNARGYDKQLENNLQSANKWSDRPPTPY